MVTIKEFSRDGKKALRAARAHGQEIVAAAEKHLEEEKKRASSIVNGQLEELLNELIDDYPEIPREADRRRLCVKGGYPVGIEWDEKPPEEPEKKKAEKQKAEVAAANGGAL